MGTSVGFDAGHVVAAHPDHLELFIIQPVVLAGFERVVASGAFLTGGG